LAVLRLDYATKKLEMLLNNEVIAEMTLPNRGVTPLNDTTFYIGNQQYKESGGPSSIQDGPRPYGFIAETGISKDILSDSALSLLWNSGQGSFYIP